MRNVRNSGEPGVPEVGDGRLLLVYFDTKMEQFEAEVLNMTRGVASYHKTRFHTRHPWVDRQGPVPLWVIQNKERLEEFRKTVLLGFVRHHLTGTCHMDPLDQYALLSLCAKLELVLSEL